MDLIYRYLFSILVGGLLAFTVVRGLRLFLPKGDETFLSESLATLLGMTERAIVTSLVIFEPALALPFILGWVALKLAGGWGSLKDGNPINQRHYQISLLGSAASIGCAVTAALWPAVGRPSIAIALSTTPASVRPTVGLGLLHDWQELAAGIIAVLAAVVVAIVVESRERGRLGRQHAAARAVLPLALSATMDYARACGLSLRDMLESAPQGPMVRNASYAPPRLDPATIPPLRDAIEAASPPVGERIATVLSSIQILASRLRTLSDDLNTSEHVVTVWNIHDYILNAAVASARTGDLFAYARRETDRAPAPYPEAKTILGQLAVWGFDISTDPDLYEMAETRAERHRLRSPGESLADWGRAAWRRLRH
jgi:hypothetical protein